jgi:hypothetical protein
MKPTRIAALIGMLLLLGGITSPASGAPLPTVSNVTVNPTPNLANHPAQYTVKFKTSGSGALAIGDKITLHFPPGTTPGTFCDDVASFASNVTVNGTVTSVSSMTFCLELKVDVPVAIGNNANVTVVLGSSSSVIGNPGAGTYATKVHTTTDFGDANSKKYTIKAQHAPIANAQAVSTAEDTAKVITLKGTDIDGDDLTFAIFAGPSHGSLGPIGAPSSCGANCRQADVTYTPTGNYNGPDTFEFRVRDGIVDSAAGTVSITVTPVNDAPVAVNDDATVAQDSGANTINVLANDVDLDGDTLTISASTAAANGTAVCGASICTYTPNAGFSGGDSFTYTASDPSAANSTATVHVDVTPTGGGGGGSPVTFDLCAVSGTANLGPTTVPIWGFALMSGPDCSDEVPTLPGPALSVSAGDSVTVTLHNEVVGQEVSLEFVGQDLFPDTVGVAAGATKTYGPFTATNPGTYLYESGGNRQVLMGLYGALVVLPSAPVAPCTATTCAYDTAASAYDVAATVVLSEVDPAFNADPTGFDLLNYKPTYWLINGQTYTGSAVASASAGERVLLRYVNAGSLHHTMEILGTHQRVIGRDAYPVRYPFDAVAETIPTGSTLDTIVTIPDGTASGAKFWLFNSQMHLDNAGAFPGGMLTFIAAGP